MRGRQVEDALMKLRYHFYFLWRAENLVTEGGRGGEEERGKREAEEEEGNEERKEGERDSVHESCEEESKTRNTTTKKQRKREGRIRVEDRTKIRKRELE